MTSEQQIIERAERLVTAYEGYWGTLQTHRRAWLRTMIAGALVEQGAAADRDLIAVLRESRQYVADPEACHHSADLVREIDAAIARAEGRAS